jgi:hypothetical protein
VAHAIDGIALLVAGQQHRQRAGMVGMVGDKLLGGHHERRHAAFMSAAPRPYSTPSRISG